MKNNMQTKETQYMIQLESLSDIGPVQLGPTASHSWRSDPRRLSFLLSRYKFCSKMLAGKSNVLEVGCGDGFGMRVVLQTVDFIHGVDFDPVFIDWAKKHSEHENLSCDFSVIDVTVESPSGVYNAAYSLDLIEHLPPDKEILFWNNICQVLDNDSIFIIGTPNKTSENYASVWSKEGHINLQSHDQIQASMRTYFNNVFMFSMNDEVVHTGFYPMAHYLLCMGVGKRLK